MINKNELRIGNYLESDGRDLIITGHYLSNMEKGMKPDNPIPITEEWLLNFGFEEINGGDMVIFKRQDSNWFIKWSDERHRYLLGYTLPLGVHCIRNWRTLDTYFKYFHELQNFYSSIGEELTLSVT
ncbi:MAG TPA: hypothetical protein PKD16_01270 [Saprospiraceae bacterium]|jgi:hypothetical protein|nr:hypothetical protein [Saprospiraceae bacterium]